MWLIMLKANTEHILKIIVQKPDRDGLRVIDIAVASGLSRNTIRRSIRYLCSHGYIRVSRPNTGVPYSYQITPKAERELHERVS